MTVRTISAGLVALSFGLAPVSASAKPPATKGGNPHLTTTSTRPSAPTSKPTTTTQTSHGNPHTTKTTGSPKTTTPSNKHTSTSGTTTPTTTSPTTTTSTTTPTSTSTLNPIAQKISAKPNLSSKLQGMLPTGMTLDQASLGFKNQGQFIAALHVSQNLGIPFADLKTAMTGINPTLPPDSPQTSTSTMSLGQAIQKLRPSADSDGATTTAEHQATSDLSTTGTTTTTTTTTTPKKTHK